LAKIPPQRKAVSSPTAREHSLLFGGAYAPNDAIYRKRYAFATIIMPPTFSARAHRKKQSLTVFSCLPADCNIKFSFCFHYRKKVKKSGSSVGSEPLFL
jgi:hypothetical protein